ncbi:MAG: Flp pilus assembly complex ATPase component TadA [Chthonomonadales bacterium]|nr:Flp pilus assembly complex ATPase component TadA [Chthonomonadales bacterium]
MVMARKSMGEYLVEKGLITADHLKQAQDMQRQSHGDLAKILVDLGFASERDVTEARAQEMGLPFVDLNKFAPDSSAINVVPEHVAKRHNVIPVKKDNNTLVVAMADTNNPYAADDLRMVSRCNIRAALAAPGAIEDAISRVYGGTTATLAPAGGSPGMNPMKAGPGGGAGMGDLMADIRENLAKYGSTGEVVDEDDEAAIAQAEEAPIIRVANAIIQQAIKELASDIHVEPERRGVRIRYRVDGVLHEAMTMPKYIQAPLISRFKIMAEMNIAERRVPQDGRIPITYEKKDYDLRVSCLPNVFGEKIVCRILDKSSILIGLNKLGFTPEAQSQLEELVIQPNGMVLSTGPTGSGKTTTQYSVLNKLNSIEKNILTIEDPVEYQLSGVTQVQVNKKAGLTFATALRSFLRQDPDIIMVGEMRDLETAEIAIESSLTGHLVLSTLHTNDAPSAVIRMIDMGVEPYLISATVIGVMAQRLGRKVCQSCKEPYEEEATYLRRFGFRPESPDQKVTLWRGRGCEACRHTGYKGRLGIYSLMRVNDEIAELIVRRAPLTDIRDAAKANGMLELREDGLLKVLEGVTTPDEVMRVVFTAGH